MNMYFVYVVKLQKRDEAAINPNLPTGAYEMYCEELRVLNSAKTPPFYIQDDIDVDENIRLKYRYLELTSSRNAT